MFLLERVSDALLRLARGELPDLLNPPTPNVSVEVARLVDATNNIIKEYANARSFLMSLSEGSLDVDPPPRNFLISPFKQLHSNLRHLTWQTQQVSKGDLSQQVDFLGDFSLAFNSMIDSLKEKRRIEEALRKSHEDLKSANTLIMESIEYASSIQKAILPSTKTFDELIKDYFIIWNPRDVIGGDLYCLDGSGDNYLLSVIDCTGHGVPGAIMTMIAASALNRATHELGYRDPAATIRRVNELVRNTLERRLEGPLYDDGLDIGTCYVNRTNREIVFAGARISLFCVDDKTANEIKGDRQSVG